MGCKICQVWKERVFEGQQLAFPAKLADRIIRRHQHVGGGAARGPHPFNQLNPAGNDLQLDRDAELMLESRESLGADIVRPGQ